MMSQLIELEIAEREWKSLYRVGGAAAWSRVIATLLQNVKSHNLKRRKYVAFNTCNLC